MFVFLLKHEKEKKVIFSKDIELIFFSLSRKTGTGKKFPFFFRFTKEKKNSERTEKHKAQELFFFGYIFYEAKVESCFFSFGITEVTREVDNLCQERRKHDDEC